MNEEEIKALQKQVKQIQKEYDILDGIIDIKDAVIAELKAENERLKELKCKFKEYCTCNTEKYVKCLQEIKEILLQAMDVKSNAYNHFLKVEQAIDLITKAEEE